MLFACVHGRLGDCRTCDITEAQDRTTSAVESQTAAIRNAEAPAYRRATQDRAEQEARERAPEDAADAAGKHRNDEARREREATEVRSGTPIDAEMARDADAEGAAHRWPDQVATVALALAGYALWLDGWSALALAAAVVVSFVLTAVIWNGVASRRERSDRYDGAYPVFVLGFALTSAAMLYLPPWLDASLWPFGLLAAVAAIALVPLRHRFDHVLTVAR